MAQVGRALLYSHHCKILHRDVKPENIFVAKTVSGDICAKLLDFGLSKKVGSTPSTQGFSNVGTGRYMAPEIGRGAYTAKVDTYSFCITLCCVFGRTMPVRNTHRAIDFRYVEAGTDPSGKMQYRASSYWGAVFGRPGVGFELQDLCLRGCHSNPELRLTMEQCMQHPFWGDLAMSAEEIEASRARGATALAHLGEGDVPMDFVGDDSIEEDFGQYNEMEGGATENTGVDPGDA